MHFKCANRISPTQTTELPSRKETNNIIRFNTNYNNKTLIMIKMMNRRFFKSGTKKKKKIISKYFNIQSEVIILFFFLSLSLSFLYGRKII